MLEILRDTDGFVVGYKGGNGVMTGLTDASNPPTTKRFGADAHDGYTQTSSLGKLQELLLQYFGYH